MLFTLALNSLLKPGALLDGQPSCVPWLVRQKSPYQQTDDDARYGLKHIKPLPAFESENAVQIQNQSGNRRANDTRHWNSDGEHADISCAIVLWKPIRQIEHHSGKQARFDSTQQKSHDVERPGTANKNHGACHKSASHHDSRQPFARSDALHHVVARNFENQVRVKEDACAKPEYLGRHSEILARCNRRESDVDSIDERNDVAEEQKRNAAAGHPCHRVTLKGDRIGSCHAARTIPASL